MKSVRGIINWGSGILCAVGLIACGPKEEGTHAEGRRHVVLITIEGLRADAVGAYQPWYAGIADGELDPSGHSQSGIEKPARASLTPHIDRLAQRSFAYGYALAPSSWSAPSLAGLLASDYPSGLGFSDLSKPLAGETVTLAEVLQRAGWRTQAFVEHPFLESRYNLDQGFETYEHVTGPSGQVRSAQVAKLASRACRKLGKQASLTWIQLGGLGPPYAPLEGESALTRSDWLRYRDHWQPEDLAALRALYEREVARVDQEVGQLLDALDNSDYTAETLVVLTASNGIELLERGLIGDGTSLHEEQVRVPLLFAVDRDWSGAIAEPVSLIDVGPSLLRWAGLSLPQDWQGVSILPSEPVPVRPLFSELSRARSLRAAIRGDHKLIWNRETEQAWLFEIFADPRELHDLSSQNPALRSELLETLRSAFPDPDRLLSTGSDPDSESDAQPR